MTPPDLDSDRQKRTERTVPPRVPVPWIWVAIAALVACIAAWRAC